MDIFQTIFAGAPTIRAYKVQQRFTQESEEKVDFNQVCYCPSIISNRFAIFILQHTFNIFIFSRCNL